MAALPLRFSHGALVEDGQRTRFALWAPDARSVELELDGASFAMAPEADGWFRLNRRCPLGALYRYRIDGELSVPDPASRFQPQGVHGPSQVLAPQRYHWRNAHWRGRPWREAVIQELHVGLLGGYAGVMRELPRLAELGITAIELMPINQFPGERNWGYDGVLPFAPQNSYGTPDELMALIDQAHGLGLMVLLDVVYNHFGPDGNYLHRYAGRFFREDRQTPWGAAIDFRRSEVRDFFIENALMWLSDYRFDGLRLDAVHAIDDPDFLRALSGAVRQHIGEQRHCWLVLENEANQAQLLESAFDGQWNDDGHNTLHVMLTGEKEGYYADFQQPTARLARCLGEGFVYQGETSHHGTPRGESSAHLAPSAFVLFLQNHDQTGNRALGERLPALCPPQALRAATTLLLLSPMIPLLFMGDEWASEQPFLFFTDHHDELADAVREGRRAEFKGFAAFADPGQRARIPDPNALQTFLDSRPRRNAHSGQWEDFHRQLLELRRQHIVPRLDGARALGADVIGEQAVSARWRLGDGSELRIDLNLGPDPVQTHLPDSHQPLFNCTEAVHQPGTLHPSSAVVSLSPTSAAEPAP
ncbi:malto-oligosyltrehalose trehalohydrolase [Pseudomonas sp. 148P]|uniref:Malto-oligosyltrehalose trehalohydrolase n=1 Tax=Pseudomonas ulcerans TaxID=3115852 RepID=A0ABU7HWG2_9PSED|nr:MULTISPECIES: malto-oligosyltrehalose trehalohydrolase [unclassified Pseudomonas]MEE1924636.1 malto-oligosyltrehalose trehalohydrolase [Pseudomonas sp. 147P]MEE1935850.1 malto-oligosyltrehalose trehalohydrolase [Pseudomonas sp. 148P]